ncbi:tetratricopeptide repeat protein [Gloeocapsopsis sp. IPPAS B-1203]|uniref:tetratricopeptide repeat protein n=1 Tax=Gloeocapsopsis sp. IPPAS B-1203 TaxID=2049454 RepID=UPI0025A1DCCB|nr:tetratricopeptide repeat protein [Gloeocapsopsis sp. IPPAS B-1203]
MKSQDYRLAAQLIKQILQETPQNPWAQLYSGQLHEVSQKFTSAQNVYRQLLQETTNSKIVFQARQGLQRVEEKLRQQRQDAIAQATADPSNTQIGVLVLEPVSQESRTSTAQTFAQIMQIDSYTARLKLPTRGWRLYKSGKIGEMRYLGEKLRAAGIPCFWVTLAEIEKIQVLQVSYFQSATPPTVVCHNEQGQQDALTFDWLEVNQRVTAQLPIFEQVVDRDVRGKLQYKTQTQDYAQFCDLHLPERWCILRLCDRSYQFQQGFKVIDQPNNQTVRLNWNCLSHIFEQKKPQADIRGFSYFADTVLDQVELLGRLKSHINLFRRSETTWDAAFHLYSGLVLMHSILEF